MKDGNMIQINIIGGELDQDVLWTALNDLCRDYLPEMRVSSCVHDPESNPSTVIMIRRKPETGHRLVPKTHRERKI